MNKRTLVIVILAVAATAIVLAWSLWPRSPMVEVIRLAEAPATRVLAINGKIRPRLSVDVQAPVGGTLRALPFDVGDQVSAGAVLARIDDAPEVAAIGQARAAVAAQEATVAQARRDLARYEALGEFVARREVEEKRLAVEEGVRELQRRRAAVVEASEQRDRRVIRAPFSGVILDRPVDPGQVVGAETVIYQLADLSRPEIGAEIDEVYAADVKPGARALVSMPGTPGQLRATVVHLEPLVDPATGAREARLQLLESPAEAPAGLTVTVNLIVDERQAALSVPRSAILQSGGEARVRVVDPEGIVRDRRVRIVDWPAERVIVETGLRPGERILASPNAARPGQKIRAAE
jgi:RND family efflux transporter MFP subunit